MCKERRGWSIRRGLLPGLLVGLLLASAGCGFRLRGSPELPPGIDALVIQAANPYSELVADLERTLRAGDIRTVGDPQRADAVLHILSEETGRRVLSVGPTGKAREYELYYIVTFGLVSSGGAQLVPPQRIVLTRDYVFDETAVLSEAEEEAFLRRDMQRQTVQQILQRLAALAPKGSG